MFVFYRGSVYNGRVPAHCPPNAALELRSGIPAEAVNCLSGNFRRQFACNHLGIQHGVAAIKTMEQEETERTEERESFSSSEGRHISAAIFYVGPPGLKITVGTHVRCLMAPDVGYTGSLSSLFPLRPSVQKNLRSLQRFQSLVTQEKEPLPQMRFTTNFRNTVPSLCLTLIVLLTFTRSASAQVAPSSPVSAYLFDEGTGTTTGDSFGSNNGVFAAESSIFLTWRTWGAEDPIPETPFGYEGNSSLLFGGNAWVDLGEPSNLDFDPQNDSFTISAWFSSASGGAIVGKAAQTLSERQYYLWDDGSDNINMAVGGMYSDYSEDTPSRKATAAPVWNHVAIAVESNTVAKIYVNGVLGDTSTIDPGTATLPGTNIYIGARHNENATNNSQAAFFFGGKIDEVAFWDSALTQENIDWLQANSLATLPVSPEGDFDGDLDVDGADFLSWQRNSGGATDLGLWEGGFGTTSAEATVSAVPEPTTALLSGFAALALALRSMRRRR